MARIAGVNIPDDKRVEVALTYIYGVGLTTSQKILKVAQVSPDVRVKDLNDTELNRIREILEKNHKVEGDLRREVVQDINRLKEIGSYRGARHKAGLPTRGQRTKTNSRTKRSRKTVVSSNRRKITKT